MTATKINAAIRSQAAVLANVTRRERAEARSAAAVKANVTRKRWAADAVLSAAAAVAV